MRIHVKEIFQLVSVLAFVALAAPRAASAQSTIPLTRVFVDCNECSHDNLREEIRFVDFVRERQAADVVAMVTSLETGAGGRSFTIELLPSGKTPGDTISVNIPPAATELEQRQIISRSLKLALLPFIRGSAVMDHIDLVYSPPAVGVNAQGAFDRWNKWVYRLSGSGFFASDEGYSALGADGGLGASRITDQFKTEISWKGNYNREEFKLSDGEIVKSVRDNWSGKALLVRSLSDHFSIGINAAAGSSTFQNTRFQMRAMPAIEYDLFPYRQATQRQLVIRYGAGVRSMKYVDTTIYNRIAESRPIHELAAVADIKRPWGNVWGNALWSQYLHDLSKRRWTTEAGVDWRIVGGLSLNASARYVIIRDQLNIQGGNLTDQERLLRLREVQSGYSFSTGVGLSYTFGSLFNNIVNPRFRL